MIELAPYILLGLLLLGTALTWLGRRGRRVNDHPVCRACRFDLHGVYPGGTTCPECGAGLKGKQSVRIGVRERRRWSLRVGVAMLVVVVLVLGTMGWLMAAGPSMNKYKPALVLALEGRYAGVKASAAAAKEAVRRLQSRGVDAASIDLFVEAALALQGDTQRRWVPEWGDVLEDARFLGKVGDADYTRFLRQSAVIGCCARPEAALGGRLPLVIGVIEWRRAATPLGNIGVWIDSLKIGGDPVEWMYHGERRLALANAGPIRVTTTLPGTWGTTPRQVSTDTLGLELDLPGNLQAGTAAVELAIRVSDEAGAVAAGKPAKSPNHAEVALVRQVRVARKDAGASSGAGATPELRSFLARTKVSLSVAEWGGDENRPAWRAGIAVPRAAAPAPFCFDVYVRINGEEFLAGSVVSGKLPRRERLGVASGDRVLDQELGAQLVADVSERAAHGANTQTCDIIFRPRTDLAALTLDMTGCCVDEVELRDVKLERTPPRVE